MTELIILIFVLGYAAIAAEQHGSGGQKIFDTVRKIGRMHRNSINSVVNNQFYPTAVNIY